jgi:hypothetical protein
MNGENHKINIKRDSLDMPVFLKSQSRGTVLLSEPLSCTSFTPYLSRMAVLLCYPPESTMYSWRKEYAANMTRSVGLEIARSAMGHNSGTNCLEDDYDDPFARLDIFAIATGVTQAKDTIVTVQSEAINRPQLATTIRERRKIVGKWVEQQPAIKTLRARA